MPQRKLSSTATKELPLGQRAGPRQAIDSSIAHRLSMKAATLVKRQQTWSRTGNPVRLEAKEWKLRTSRHGRPVVFINTKPRDYEPGSGPALQPLNLLPLRDSTAHIVERILLPSPGQARDGRPLPKRMAYIVGWHDLPAASLLVPALDILDYVSPQALEEWEWQLEVELDEERARLEEDKKTAVESKVQRPGKRKHSRPPPHSQIEAAVAAAPQPDEVARSRSKKGIISLTTPQKRDLDAFEGLSDDEISPSQQLLWDRQRYQSLVAGNADMVGLRPYSESAFDSDSGTGYEYAGGGLKSGVPSREHGPPFLRLPASLEGEAALAKAQSQEFPSSLPVTPLATLSHEATALVVQPGVRIQDSTSGAKSSPGLMFLSTVSQQQSHRPDPPVPPPAEAVTFSQISEPALLKSAALDPRVKTDLQGKASLALDDAELEPQWEVKRIEGMELYEVEGVGLVRYFKVRWEGDWPPDQNPTWEPESNLPANLIRSFVNTSKKKRTRLERLSNNQKRKRPDRDKADFLWGQGKRYTSVSEAFAGDDLDSSVGNLAPSNGGWAGDEVEMAEEMFVVDDGYYVPLPGAQITPYGKGRESCGTTSP